MCIDAGENQGPRVLGRVNWLSYHANVCVLYCPIQSLLNVPAGISFEIQTVYNENSSGANMNCIARNIFNSCSMSINNLALSIAWPSHKNEVSSPQEFMSRKADCSQVYANVGIS